MSQHCHSDEKCVFPGDIRSLSTPDIVCLSDKMRQVIRRQFRISGEEVCYISNSAVILKTIKEGAQGAPLLAGTQRKSMWDELCDIFVALDGSISEELQCRGDVIGGIGGMIESETSTEEQMRGVLC